MIKMLDILKSKSNTDTKNNQPLKNKSAELEKSTLKQLSRDLKELGAGVAALELQDLQAFWLSIMTSSKATNKEKLQASKLYADSIGAFEQNQANKTTMPIRYSWGAESVSDAEIVQTKVQKDDQ